MFILILYFFQLLQEIRNNKNDEFNGTCIGTSCSGHATLLNTCFNHNNGKIIDAKIVCSTNTNNVNNNINKKSKKSQEEKDLSYEKLRQLCSYDDAPNHLKFNPFIREGYRKELTTKLCLESIFWWTNETVIYILLCFNRA